MMNLLILLLLSFVIAPCFAFDGYDLSHLKAPAPAPSQQRAAKQTSPAWEFYTGLPPMGGTQTASPMLTRAELGFTHPTSTKSHANPAPTVNPNPQPPVPQPAFSPPPAQKTFLEWLGSLCSSS